VANSRSARKRIRSSERKRIRNRDARSAVRTRVARVRRSLVSGQIEGIQEELTAAVRALDKAAEKGILHRNNAARRKSRIMSMAARLSGMSGSEAEKAATRAAAAGGAKGTTTRTAATRARGAAAEKAAPVAAEPAKPERAAPGTATAPRSRRGSRSTS
jgi:small subunit ribosomal protein S20